MDSAPQPPHTPNPTTEAPVAFAPDQTSAQVPPSPSLNPIVPLSPAVLQDHPPSAPTQLQPQPRSTTLTRLPAQGPSLVPPPSVLSAGQDDSAEVSRALTTWQAARESVLSQMVTSQDIVTPATVPRAKAKTGGRRGRGGRRSTNKIPGQVSSGPEAIVSTPRGGRGSISGRGRGRGQGRGGGRPRVRPIGTVSGSKRKRSESEDESKALKDESESSETFTPLPTQSRSGRRIFQASAFTPAVIDLEASTDVKALPANGSTAPVERVRRGRRGYRKTGDASVCKNCGRGHSPASNTIVFCDGCNTPWHQYCHDKPISNDVVLIEEKEWFCADCEVMREEEVQLKGKVSAEGMSLAEVLLPVRFLPRRNLYNNISWQTKFRNDDIYKHFPPHISSLFFSTPPISIQPSPSSPPLT